MVDIKRSFVDKANGEIDREAFETFTEELWGEFTESAEFEHYFTEYGDSNWSELFLEYAIDYIGVMLPKVSVRNVQEILFELFPRKVSTEASNAAEIIAELRAFWQFLQRQYHLKNAAAILAILNDTAARRLENELANPRNFGMAKSFFMLGQQMGFDMTTQEGMDTFLQHYNRQMAGQGGGMFPAPIMDEFAEDEVDEDEFDDGEMISLLPSMTPKQRADLRKKRKSQRQARKQNRRKK